MTYSLYNLYTKHMSMIKPVRSANKLPFDSIIVTLLHNKILQ